MVFDCGLEDRKSSGSGIVETFTYWELEFLTSVFLHQESRSPFLLEAVDLVNLKADEVVFDMCALAT